ncbi:transposase, MuDR, MULE transposase domain protein [Tanacetum coccineum]
MNRGSILHEDLTYTMLHEMVLKKFNLEANYPLNLSAKLSSIDDNFDITDDHEVWFFVECACNSKEEIAHLYVSQHKTLYDTTRFLENTFYNFFEPTTLENIGPSNNITNTSFDNNGLDLNFGTSDFHNNESNHQNESHFKKPECSFSFGDYHEYEDEKNEFDDVVDDNPLPDYHKWQKYMSFKPDITETLLYKSKPMISKHYKKETDVKVGQNFDNKEALDLAIRLKALDEGYQFLNDRSAPESYALKCFHFNECAWKIRATHATHLKGQYKGTNLIAVGMDGNNQIVPIALGICKGEKGPCWSWWMSVLKECIGDNPSLVFIFDKHAAIALAVQNELPLAYHAVCCRHLMMNLSLKRDKTKALFWKICKAYTTEEFSSSMSHLQDIQPDAYDKLCQVGPQRWSRAHCPLVRYNYLTSNSVESVNACTVVYRKLPVIKLTETYRAMVQDWYYKRRKLAGLVKLADALQDRNMLLMYAQSHQNRLHVYVSRVEISPLVVADQHKDEENKKEKQGKPSYMISYLTRKLSRRFTTLYYTLPPNNTLPGLKQIKNDYDTNVMYDIAKVAGKIQIFVSHHQIDLSTVLIPNDGSLEEAFADDARTTIISNLQRELEAEATLANTMLGNLTGYIITNAYPEIQIKQCCKNMPTMSLNSYGLHALLMTHEADIRVLVSLQEAYDEESCLEEQIVNLMHRLADRFTRRRPKIYRLKSLPNHPLIDYSRYALERMTDMRIVVKLRMARDELLRSMEEKQKFINNYNEM